MPSNYKILGDYIEQINIRNEDDSIDLLLGVNLDKVFIPSVANINGTDMTTYKIIKKGQFGCKLMSVGRDGRLPISRLVDNDFALISSAYYVFEVIDENILLPDYLMMWFRREESDRYLWFLSGGDIRGRITWEEFCSLPIKVPTIDEQKALVKEYNTVQNRINLNNQLIQKLEETAQAIYKEWFVEFEFPNEDGKPYKSNGGEMAWNDELGKEIPKNWEYKNLGSTSIVKAGGDKPKVFSPIKTDEFQVPIYSNSSENEGLYGYTNTSIIQKESITISARGAIIGYTVLRMLPFVPIVRLIVVTPQDKNQLNYLYETIRKFTYEGSGSAQGQLTIPEISAYKIILPTINVLESFQKISFLLKQNIEIYKRENQKLSELKELLLSKLSTVKN